MISVVCWMWSGPLRSFLPGHVNALRRMVAHYLPIPHRFICVTDEQTGLDPAVEWIRTPSSSQALGGLYTPEGPRFPSCYRRLWGFSEEARILGDRILVIDIDLVVLRDMSHIFAETADFVGWRPYRDWGSKLRFGGGMYLMTTGSRSFVWDDFKGQSSIHESRRAGFRGSDQAWISYKLAPRNEAYFGKDKGLYSVRDLTPKMKLPADACVVQFNGNEKPWQSNTSWVRSAWAQFEDPALLVPLPPSQRPPAPPRTMGEALSHRYRRLTR